MVDDTTGTESLSKNLFLSKNLLKKRVRDKVVSPQKGLINRSIFEDTSNIAKSSGVFPDRKKARIAAPIISGFSQLDDFSSYQHQHLQQVSVPIVENADERTERLITDMLTIDGDDTFAGLTDLMPMVPREIMPRPETNGIVQMKGEGLVAPASPNENAEPEATISPAAIAKDSKAPAKMKRTKEQSKASHRLIERRRTKRLNDLLTRLKGEVQLSGLKVRKDKASVLESAIDCIKNMRSSMKQISNRLNLANMRERSYYMSQELCLKGMAQQQQQVRQQQQQAQNPSMFMRQPMMGMSSMYPSMPMAPQPQSCHMYPPLVPRPCVPSVLTKAISIASQ